MGVVSRTFGLFGRRCGAGESVSVKFASILLIVTVFLVSSASCKKYNATSVTQKSDPAESASNAIATSFINDTVTADSSSSSSSSFTVGTSRQARDYNPGGGGGSVGGGGGSSYSVGGGGGSHASASSYGAPSSGGGGGYGSVAAGGGYPNPQYAIPPIVLQNQGGYGMSGGGWGADEDEGFGDFGGGEDLKSLIGLLGLKGLKGLKGVKAVKALKGLGLLALLPLSPILLPLLPLLLILGPLLLLAPLLLPLLLLLFLPVPVISVPGRRRKRDLTSGASPITTSKTLLQETMDDIMAQIPSDFASLRWKEVDQCMDKFICDTGMMVSRVAPSMATPAAWLLGKLWPEPLQSKVETFRKVTEMMKHSKKSGHFSNANSFYSSYNLYPAKQSSGICTVNYKCRVKKLENLFHTLVVQQTEKLKGKLIERIPPGEMSAANIFRALLT